ncbi:hypothetical protein AMTRI_Chr11g97150 [Amborella trichopoda]
MLKFTKKRELVRPRVTGFSTAYFSLQSMYKRRIALRFMFASEEWSRCKWSRDAKGKKTRDIILSKYFWRGVKHAILVFLPLVKVWRLVDADKPSMGFIYDVMERAKNEIAENLGDDAAKYAPIWEIIDDKWNRQLHRPLHAAGYYLNPKFFYADADIESKGVIMDGFNECLEKLVPDPNVQDKISIEELISYKCSLMSFGKDMALRQRNKDEPAQWWRQHGSSASNLQKMAMRILSLTTTSSGCECNWSSFKMGLTWEMVEEASGQAYDPRRATRATSSAATSRREIEEEEADSEEYLEEEEYVEEGDDSDDGLNSDVDESNEDDDSDSY